MRITSDLNVPLPLPKKFPAFESHRNATDPPSYMSAVPIIPTTETVRALQQKLPTFRALIEGNSRKRSFKANQRVESLESRITRMLSPVVKSTIYRFRFSPGGGAGVEEERRADTNTVQASKTSEVFF